MDKNIKDFFKYDPDVQAFEYTHSNDGQDLIAKYKAAKEEAKLKKMLDNGVIPNNVVAFFKSKLEHVTNKEELIAIRNDIQKLNSSPERAEIVKLYNQKLKNWTLKQ